MKRIKNFSFILIISILCGCASYENNKFDDVPYVNLTSVDLYIGNDAPTEYKSVQLTSSPEGKQYQWSSIIPSVATVTQSGLVTAVGEGFTEITVASENHTTSVNVNVHKWVPLTGFTLGATSKYVNFAQRFQILLYPEPADASVVNVKWTSSNPDICQVLDNGWATFWGDVEGESVTITATIEGFPPQEKTFMRRITPTLLDMTTWSFPGAELQKTDGHRGSYGFSSSMGTDDGVGLEAMLRPDNDDGGNFWHTAWNNPNLTYPHWFIIDLGAKAEVSGVLFRRRLGNGGTAKGYYVFTYKGTGSIPTDGSNSPPWYRDDNNNNQMGGVANWKDYWQQQGFDWPFDPSTDDPQTNYMDEENLPAARYFMFYFDKSDQGSGQYAFFSRFRLYGRYVE